MVNAKFTDITKSHNTLDPDLASCGAEARTATARQAPQARAEQRGILLFFHPALPTKGHGQAMQTDYLFQFTILWAS